MTSFSTGVLESPLSVTEPSTSVPRFCRDRLANLISKYHLKKGFITFEKETSQTRLKPPYV